MGRLRTHTPRAPSRSPPPATHLRVASGRSRLPSCAAQVGKAEIVNHPTRDDGSTGEAEGAGGSSRAKKKGCAVM